MDDIIQLKLYPLKTTLGNLVKDKSTKKNIVWATDGYMQCPKVELALSGAYLTVLPQDN